MSEYVYNDKFFECIDSDEKAYWLGFLYADGSIHELYRNHKIKAMVLELALAEKDKSHVERFVKDIGSNVPLDKRYTKLNNNIYYSYRARINNTKICRDLISLGCTPRKSLTLTFPDIKLLNGLESSFIRGYFDGDGCICYSQRNYVDKRNKNEYVQKYMIVSIVGTNDFLMSLSNILKKYGINFKTVNQSNTGKAKEIRLTKKNEIKKFYDYIYNNCSIKLERKHSKFIESFKQFDDLKMAS